MKLRIQGNSLRLRVSRSELSHFVETGHLEETVFLGPDSALTYALARDRSAERVAVASSTCRIVVLLPEIEVRSWSETERVGIAGEINLGIHGMLSVLVEKDFACLDRGEDENADTFPNPLAAHAC